MIAHGTAVRALGVLTIAYALALAWDPIQFLRTASAFAEGMAKSMEADPPARAVLEREGKTAHELAQAAR